MKASKNLVNLQILVSRHCIDMCITAYICQFVNVWYVNNVKFNSLYSTVIMSCNMPMLMRVIWGFKTFLWYGINKNGLVATSANLCELGKY